MFVFCHNSRDDVMLPMKRHGLSESSSSSSDDSSDPDSPGDVSVSWTHCSFVNSQFQAHTHAHTQLEFLLHQVKLDPKSKLCEIVVAVKMPNQCWSIESWFSSLIHLIVNCNLIYIKIFHSTLFFTFIIMFILFKMTDSITACHIIIYSVPSLLSHFHTSMLTAFILVRVSSVNPLHFRIINLDLVNEVENA